MDFSKKQRYGLSILSGLLLVLAFPYTGSITPLIFVGLIPLLLVEHSVYTKKYRPRKIFVHAYITFFIYNLGATWWIWNASVQGALMAFLFNSFLMASFFLFYAWTKRFVGQKEGYLGLFIYWIAFEFFHYHWELSYPWMNFGNAFSVTPQIVQWYSYFGVLGGTFWVILINLVGFKAVSNVLIKKETWRIQTPIFWLFGLLIAIPSLLSTWNYYSFEDVKNPAEIVVVQPNFDAYKEKFTTPLKVQLKTVLDLADSLVTPSTKFVLAPETAISRSADEDNFITSSTYELLLAGVEKWKGAALYIGAGSHKYFDKKNSRASKPLSGGPGYYESYNSSLLIAENIKPTFIHKSKLVLGVEKVPFSQYFPFLEELALSNGGSDGTLGVEKEPKILKAKGISFAPVVCYESIYGGFVSDQCRLGAEAIFIITNDDWWGDTPGFKQHLSFARLRAIENGKWVARSANTGSSAFINPRGEVVQQTQYKTKTGLRQTIQLNGEKTFYTMYGDWLGRSFGFVALLMLVFTFVKYFRGRKGI